MVGIKKWWNKQQKQHPFPPTAEGKVWSMNIHAAPPVQRSCIRLDSLCLGRTFLVLVVVCVVCVTLSVSYFVCLRAMLLDSVHICTNWNHCHRKLAAVVPHVPCDCNSITWLTPSVPRLSNMSVMFPGTRKFLIETRRTHVCLLREFFFSFLSHVMFAKTSATGY